MFFGCSQICTNNDMSRVRASGLHRHLALALMRIFPLFVICSGRGFFCLCSTRCLALVVQRLLSDFGRPRRAKTAPMEFGTRCWMKHANCIQLGRSCGNGCATAVTLPGASLGVSVEGTDGMCTLFLSVHSCKHGRRRSDKVRRSWRLWYKSCSEGSSFVTLWLVQVLFCCRDDAPHCCGVYMSRFAGDDAPRHFQERSLQLHSTQHGKTHQV